MAITKISADVVDFDSALVVSPTLTIGDATAEDTKIVFDGNAQDYYIGLDDSSDELLIGRGSAVGTTPVINISSAGTATFQHPIVLQSGATQGLYIENNAGNATTPRITNDANDWTVIRPGVSGGDVAINNFANTANRVVFRDEGNVEIGDGNLVVASGHGIDFSATTEATTTGVSGQSELLDDYECGSWNPQIIAGTTNPSGGANLDTKGSYTKIGRQVFCTFLIGVSWTNSPSGSVYVQGLPFTIANHDDNNYHFPVTTYNFAVGNAETPALSPQINTQTLLLYMMGAGAWGTANFASHMTASPLYITGQFSYFV